MVCTISCWCTPSSGCALYRIKFCRLPSAHGERSWLDYYARRLESFKKRLRALRDICVTQSAEDPHLLFSTRGDTYLRTLLIHGARSVLTRGKEPGAWLQKIIQRRPLNVVVVALANKMARTIWALLKHDREYQADRVIKATA